MNIVNESSSIINGEEQDFHIVAPEEFKSIIEVFANNSDFFIPKEKRNEFEIEIINGPESKPIRLT
ncbi:hypothetical protein DID75_01350 [Candidatus Marinamargulisbacteria bacterium SCGC AG-410-N11]|nr:hypothetical protein DID75_01350 [Candidatus Marinamargulisbacteria bacterium SCGC AG-410-N11]